MNVELARITSELDQDLLSHDYLFMGEVAVGVREALREVARHARMVEIVGSVRRQDPHPGDIDILLVPTDEHLALSICEQIADDPDRIVVDDYPKRYLFQRLGAVIDVIISEEKRWGMDMINYTGPRAFNRVWEERAKRRGYITRSGVIGTEIHHGYLCRFNPAFANHSEAEILARLGLLEYMDPRLRNAFR